MRLHMAAPMGHPDFLDLPWGLPLEEWVSERLVEVPRGMAGHVVRCVNDEGALYALKELPERLAAYLVDAETGEIHPHLTDGQREQDLAIARENIAGELMDLQAAFGQLHDVDPIDTADEICHRYQFLWGEVTKEEVFGPKER